jgi:hypothetical protein
MWFHKGRVLLVHAMPVFHHWHWGEMMGEKRNHTHRTKQNPKYKFKNSLLKDSKPILGAH